jgi:hypothetical protein
MESETKRRLKEDRGQNDSIEIDLILNKLIAIQELLDKIAAQVGVK